MPRFEDYLLSELKSRNSKLKEEKSKIESELKLLNNTKVEYEKELSTFKSEYESLKQLEKDYLETIQESKLPKAIIDLNGEVETVSISDLQLADIHISQDWLDTKEIPKEIYNSIIKSGYPLPSDYYIDHKEGKAWVQMHFRGIEPEKYESVKSGKMEIWESLVGQSVHMDLRIDFGLDKLVQYVITENNIQSMLNMMKGIKRETANGVMNVQHSKIVSKPSGEPEGDTRYYKSEPEFASIDKEGATIAQNLDISDGSYWIEPGGIGATSNTYSYMMLIWEGKILTGTERHDYHELFMYKENSKDELFNGKFSIKCLSDGTENRWEIWKSISEPLPLDPIMHSDCGYHFLVPADKVDGLGREFYRNVSVDLYEKKLKG